MSRRIIVLFFLIGLVWGCSINNEDTENKSGSIVLSGTYRGIWASDITSDTGQITSNFVKDDNQVHGFTSFTASPCFQEGPFEGEIDNTQLNGAIDVGRNQKVEVEGNIIREGENISGQYTVSGGTCDRDQGTFSLNRGLGDSENSGPDETISPPVDMPPQCCRVCMQGKACGNSCISRARTCRQPPGCACDA